jgi:hypothetical protein
MIRSEESDKIVGENESGKRVYKKTRKDEQMERNAKNRWRLCLSKPDWPKRGKELLRWLIVEEGGTMACVSLGCASFLFNTEKNKIRQIKSLTPTTESGSNKHAD